MYCHLDNVVPFSWFGCIVIGSDDFFNPVHVIVGMLISTFGLSMMIAVVSKRKIKYLFCLLAVALFIGSIPIYYNTSAYETVIWYFAISVGGLLLGFLIDKFVDSVYNKK